MNREAYYWVTEQSGNAQTAAFFKRENRVPLWYDNYISLSRQANIWKAEARRARLQEKLLFFARLLRPLRLLFVLGCCARCCFFMRYASLCVYIPPYSNNFSFFRISAGSLNCTWHEVHAYLWWSTVWSYTHSNNWSDVRPSMSVRSYVLHTLSVPLLLEFFFFLAPSFSPAGDFVLPAGNLPYHLSLCFTPGVVLKINSHAF